MIYSIKNKDEFKDLEESEDLQSKVKQVRLVEKLGKQGFHYDIKEVLERITKAVTAIKNYLRRLNSIQKQLRNWMNQMFI